MLKWIQHEENNSHKLIFFRNTCCHEHALYKDVMATHKTQQPF